MKRRTTYWITGIAILVTLLTLSLRFWFKSPLGTGEYRESPDGRYTAHASNMSDGTLGGNRPEYIKISVEETSSSRDIWRIVLNYTGGVDRPEYGMRGIKFILWADDSTSVTVPVFDGQKLVLPVPQQ